MGDRRSNTHEWVPAWTEKGGESIVSYFRYLHLQDITSSKKGEFSSSYYNT